MGGKEEEAVESREDETCMNNGEAGDDKKVSPKWQSHMTDVWSGTKNMVDQHYCRISVILTVLCILLIIIVIALIASIAGYKCPEPLRSCDSGQCLAAASQVKHDMDLNHSPCRNMWNYSCGSWLEANRVHLQAAGSWGQEDELQDSLDHELRKLIDTIPQGVENNSPLHKLHRFYRSCMDVEGLEHWPLDQLKDIIYEMRGWRLLGNWQPTVWDRNTNLALLQANYAVEPFFSVDVEWDDLSAQNIIKIKPGGLGMPSKDIYLRPLDDPLVRAYKDFISNALQVLQLTNAIDAAKFADDMYSFEIRIAKMSPNSSQLRDRSSQYQVLKLSELSTKAPMVKWQNLLEKYFPKATIGPNTRVGIYAPQYFTDLSRLLSTTDDMVLNDYYMWRLLMANLEHLNHNARSLVAKYHDALKGVPSSGGLPQEERWRYCVRLTNHHLGHAFSSLYIKSYLSPNVTHEIDKLIDQVLSTLVGHVSNGMPWLRGDSLEKEVLRNKIRGMKKEIGFPVMVLEDRALENYYATFEVRLSHFQNILNANSFHRKKKETLLLNPYRFSWKDNSQDPVARYFPNGNILNIGAGLLQPPYYKQGYPEPQLYGIMAHILIPTILQFMDDIGVQYQQDGLLEEWRSNATREEYVSRFQQCTVAAGGRLPPQSGEPQLEDVVTQIGALKLAYETMERLTPADQRAAPLPTLPLTSSQLFFVSYVQAQCQLLTPQREAILAHAYGQLSNRDRVQFILEQVPEFWKSFKCPSSPGTSDCPTIW